MVVGKRGFAEASVRCWEMQEADWWGRPAGSPQWAEGSQLTDSLVWGWRRRHAKTSDSTNTTQTWLSGCRVSTGRTNQNLLTEDLSTACRSAWCQSKQALWSLNFSAPTTTRPQNTPYPWRYPKEGNYLSQWESWNFLINHRENTRTE